MKRKYEEKDFRKDYRKLMGMITERLQRAQESWEVDEELWMLWQLGDKGDLNSLVMYGLAVLMEDKGWYDLREGQIVLETCAEEGNAMGQFYLGMLLFDGREGLPADKVTAMYWIRKAAEQEYPDAVQFIKDWYES